MQALPFEKYDKRDDESYQEHAERIAKAVGLRIEIKSGMPKCPKWGKGSHGTHCPYGKCDGYHGKHWRVAFHVPANSIGRDAYVFSFWSSVNDDMQGFHRPTVYDVLACLDWKGATDPDEIVEEYGPMPPSQAIACAEQNKALRDLFIVSPWKRETLGTIR